MRCPDETYRLDEENNCVKCPEYQEADPEKEFKQCRYKVCEID